MLVGSDHRTMFSLVKPSLTGILGMAMAAGSQPPPVAGLPTMNNYIAALHNTTNPEKSEPIVLKPIKYLHGEPTNTWTKKEFDRLCIKQNIQYAVVAKFSYGRPDFQLLRKNMPTQLEIKGACNIGYLEDRHVLIRLSY
ncbi:hypothetical protein RDI58_013052 [Solanum bulbocastanum]|uniref:DUF4283 domain-containing protein n=1 Tax=Solanum bulbocastanum TaxID=147425 RepID=A0AAN8YHC5_SOLBU